MGAHEPSDGWQRDRQGLKWCRCERSLGRGQLFTQEGAEDRAAGGSAAGLGRGSQEEKRVTLGKEMSLVFPIPNSKDPMDLVWVGWVEEDRLPWALREKSG